MKKFNKIFLSLILVLILAMPLLAGCSLSDLFGGNTNKEVDAIEIVGTIKTQYLVNEEFDNNGAKLLVTFTDETTKEISLTKSMTNFDSSTVGSKTLTITYNNKTTTASYRVDRVKLGVNYTYRYEGYLSNYSLENEQENQNFYLKFKSDNTALMVTSSQLEYTWQYDADNNIVISSIVNDSQYTVVVASANIIRINAGAENWVLLFRVSE